MHKVTSHFLLCAQDNTSLTKECSLVLRLLSTGGSQWLMSFQFAMTMCKFH